MPDDKFFDTDVADEAKLTPQMMGRGAADGLQDAARSGDVDKLQRVLRQGGVSLNAKDAEGCTLLH